MNQGITPYRSEEESLRAQVKEYTHELDLFGAINQKLQKDLQSMDRQYKLLVRRKFRPIYAAIGFSTSLLALAGMVAKVLKWPIFDSVIITLACIGMVGFAADFFIQLFNPPEK